MRLRTRLILILATFVCAHFAYTGMRLLAILEAVKGHAGAAAVGSLAIALTAAPIFMSLYLGRVTDRIGMRLPMFIGLTLLAIAAAIPALHTNLPLLFVSMFIGGAGFVCLQTVAQHGIGILAPPERRTEFFSYFSLAISISNVSTPVICGYTLDHFGSVPAFTMVAIVPVLTLIIAMQLPQVAKTHSSVTQPEGSSLARMRSLLANPALRNLLLANALVSSAWDLHTFLMPVLGVQNGLSAGEIGLVLGVFGAATFAIRAAMPLLSRRFDEWRLILISITTAAVVYAAYPWLTSWWTMAAWSFVLGCGVGMSQPNVLSLMHHVSPPGRAGEVVGLRLMVMYTIQSVIPFSGGLIAAAFGIMPVFLLMATSLGAGRWHLRTHNNHKEN